MRIVHFNIYEGCRDDVTRLEGVLAWVAGQQADVVGLAELNGWAQSPGLAARAAACGFPYSHLLVGKSPYHIGLLARAPIVVLQEIIDGVHHGILHLRVGDVEYVYTHFSPHERLMRLHEAQLCAQIVQRSTGPLVLMGDLNSHSPLDQPLYEACLTPENSAWALDFEAQQILLNAGLMDAAATADARWTVPTALYPDSPKRRLDYLYVNPVSKQRHPAVQCRIVHGPEVANLSDHYPIICDTIPQ
jgi:exodeoxyribonuclease-3